MADADSRVTIHMAASLDGFIARKDGSVDWLGLGWSYGAFFEKLDREIALHLGEVKAYKSGMVELRYEVRQASRRL